MEPTVKIMKSDYLVRKQMERLGYKNPSEDDINVFRAVGEDDYFSVLETASRGSYMIAKLFEWDYASPEFKILSKTMRDYAIRKTLDAIVDARKQCEDAELKHYQMHLRIPTDEELHERFFQQTQAWIKLGVTPTNFINHIHEIYPMKGLQKLIAEECVHGCDK